MCTDAHPPRSAANGAVEDVRAAEASGRIGFAFTPELEAGRAADDLEGCAS